MLLSARSSLAPTHLTPCGLRRAITAGAPTSGSNTTAFDAGLDRFVSRKKQSFVGRDAFLAQAELTRQYRFAGFVLDGHGADALPSDPICRDGHPVGYVSSGGTGFRIGKRLVLGYLTVDTRPGDVFDIEVLGEPVRANRCHGAILRSGKPALEELRDDETTTFGR